MSASIHLNFVYKDEILLESEGSSCLFDIYKGIYHLNIIMYIVMLFCSIIYVFFHLDFVHEKKVVCLIVRILRVSLLYYNENPSNFMFFPPLMHVYILHFIPSKKIIDV